MADESRAPTFKNLSDALERIERSLRGASTAGLGEPLQSEVQDSLEELNFLVGALRDTYGERPYRHLLGEDSPAQSFASLEIEKKPRPARADDPDPVFIIGHWRSGTTLLSWLFDSHPRFAAIPENQLLTSLCGAAAVSREPYRARLLPLVWAYQSVQFLGEERPRYFERYGELVRGVFGDYARRQGKPRWVGKELLLHGCLDLIDLLFGYRPRFVYIHRHGLDAALSAAERFGARDGAPQLGPTTLDLETYLSYWVEQNGPYLDFCERNPRRCHRLSYEDLVLAPEVEGRKVFAFVDEPWPETILDDMQRQDHHEGLGDNKIFETGGRIDPRRRERWKSLPAAIVRQLGRRADPLLTRLGYSPVGEA
ncbi:MAG TPA: sulfotransferase [Candidatus Polarisedimenticolaceae bacterium]|nr:sulfotransferase [Candidatus Polarisedimenticolaceae bacterium]